MEIFDEQILPVLTYDGVIWGIPGIPTSNNYLQSLDITENGIVLQVLCQKGLPKDVRLVTTD